MQQLAHVPARLAQAAEELGAEELDFDAELGDVGVALDGVEHNLVVQRLPFLAAIAIYSGSYNRLFKTLTRTCRTRSSPCWNARTRTRRWARCSGRLGRR